VSVVVFASVETALPLVDVAWVPALERDRAYHIGMVRGVLGLVAALSVSCERVGSTADREHSDDREGPRSRNL